MQTKMLKKGAKDFGTKDFVVLKGKDLVLPTKGKVREITGLSVVWLYVLIMSRTCFRMNPHSIVA